VSVGVEYLEPRRKELLQAVGDAEDHHIVGEAVQPLGQIFIKGPALFGGGPDRPV